MVRYSAVVAGLLMALALATPVHADISIAAVGPLTGQDAVTGEQMQRGAEAAVEAINAKGGVLGQKLKLILKDDACDPKQAVAIANQLAGQGIAAVVGPMCSGAAIPASKVYAEENMLMISPSATSPLLTDQGLPTIFRTCGRDDQQGEVVARYMAEKFAGKVMAIVQDKTAYGQGLAEQVRKILRNLGQPEKLYESVNRGERDYSSLIAKFKQNSVDVVFYGGYHPEAGLIVRQMRAQGMPTVLIGADDMATKQFWAITGDAGNGALMSFNSDPRLRPEAAEAVARLRSKGFDPEGMTLYTYAAVELIAASIEKAGKVDSIAAASALHAGMYPTVLGNISFDAKGDVTKPDYIIYRWSNGDYTPD